MINLSKALLMSFAVLILTGPSYAGTGNEDLTSDIGSPNRNESEEKSKDSKGDVKKEKENEKQPNKKQPKEKK